MALHRLTALALTGVLALSASGCGGDSPSPSPRTSSAAASPTPTSSGPAAPALPKAAVKGTPPGARAFARYWFQLVTYAMHTGRTIDLKQAAAEECRGCNNLITQIEATYAHGRHIRGGGWFLKELAVDSRVAMPYQRFAVSIEQPESDFVNAEGKVTAHGRAERSVLAFSVLWRNGRWVAFESAVWK